MLSRRALITRLLLFMLSVWTVGGCARLDYYDTKTGERSLSLLMSLKNVVPGKVETTKMTTDITQSGGVFRGIADMYVIPFNTEYCRVEPADSRLGAQNVILGNSGISKFGLISGNNSHLFGSAFVPNGMNSVLVYGKSPDQGEDASKDIKHIYGVLNPEGLSNPSGSDDISFHLERVLNVEEGTNELTEITNTADGLLDKLNMIMSMMGNSQYAAILGVRDAVKRENNILACSYSTFDQIRNDILNLLVKIPFESVELTQEIGRISSELSDFSLMLADAGTNFPASYGIPEGALGFWWNGREFIRLINGVNISLVDPGAYCYPPGLWYYANSSVKTSNSDKAWSQYTPENANWGDILAFYQDGQEVNSFTQSVAIEYPLQYGVGLLEVSLSTPGEEATNLLKGCPLVGIIVGDQKDVDFMFQPKAGLSRYIYDNVASGVRIGSTEGCVQTLVLPTVTGVSVHFALEFRNNTGREIPCQQGKILPKCKFYLAGVLEVPEDGCVFSSDLKTSVSVKVDGVRSAYNTVPDLHSPQLEVGVVAEMKWNQLTPQGIVLDF